MAKICTSKSFAVFVVVSICTCVHSQTFKLLKDINTQTNSFPSNTINSSTSFATLNGKAYFAADDGIHGVELWSSDGTAEGTALVKDINPGAGSAMVNYIYAFNEKVYFFATSGSQYMQLWSSDGTSGGTTMLKDSLENTFVTYIAIRPAQFSVLGNKLFFTVTTGYDNEQLWQTDGTSSGTKLFINFFTAPFNYSAGVNSLTTINGLMYFALEYNNWVTLWVTDGTVANTHIVNYKGYNKGGSISIYGTIGNKLLFYGTDGNIWETQGDSLNSAPVGLPPNSVASLVYFKGSFYVFSQTPETFTDDFYKFNNITSHLDLIKPVHANQGGKMIFFPTDSLLFLVTSDSSFNTLLWATDGTTTGTTLLLTSSTELSNFYAAGKKLYFSNSDATNGEELWVSDGSSVGTAVVKDINPGIYNSSPSNITAANSKIFFSASSGAGVELWKSDGTAAGTGLVKDINVTSTSSSYPNFDINRYDTINNKLVFWAYDGVHGSELWAADAQNTVLLKDIVQGSASGDERTFVGANSYSAGVNSILGTRFKGYDYFFAGSGNANFALWKTAGTAATTSSGPRLFESSTGINPGKTGATTNYLFAMASPYISLQDAVNYDNLDSTGSRLYSYDGINTPLLLKKGFISSFGRSDGRYMLAVGNTMYFFVSPRDGQLGMELWKSDGTVGGTTLVKNLYPGQSSNSSFSNYLVQYKEQLFFTANSGYSSGLPSADFDNGAEYLWKSDGTAAGTAILKKVKVDEEPIVISNNKLFFTANDGTSGYELWVTDGTSDGTHLVKDIAAGTASSQIVQMLDFNGVLYFSANDGTGAAMWKSDGTEAGTVMVTKATGNFVKAGNKFYFISGDSIWQSDGTATGTKPLDRTGLEDVQGLQKLIYANGRLYFLGYSYKYGQEIYTTAQSLLPVSLLSFTCILQGNNSLLNWTTVNEQSNNYFNVQRSINGTDFSTIGRVNAGHGLKEINYNYTDENVTALGVSKLYYRLQQVDLDGKFTYSKTIQLGLALSNLLHVAPNPAAGFTNLYSTVNMPGAVIKLVDISGRVLYVAKQNIAAGSKITIPLFGYAKGLYSITVESANIKKQEYKLVIQ